MPVPNVGRIFAEEFKTIEETIVPTLKEWAPRNFIKSIKKGQRGYPERVDWANGSITYLRVYQQDVEAQEGSRFHWAAFDEPPPYATFVAVRRGLLDFHGVWWMALTPLTEPWIWDILVAKAGPGKHVEHFSYSMFNNGPPYGPMTTAAIDEFIADLTPEEYEARVLGNPRYLIGRVFPEWKPEEPFYKPYERLSPHFQRYCIIDPHPRKPFAVLWLAHDRDTGRVYAYDELWDKSLRTISDIAAAIHLKERLHRKKYESMEANSVHIVARIIDDAAEEEERGTGTSIREQLAECGIVTLKAYKKNKDAGYQAIHEALKISTITKRPQLTIFTNCAETASNFLKHVWDEWANAKDRGIKDPKQEAKAKDDDFIACLRYFYQRRFNTEAPQVLYKPVFAESRHMPMGRPGLWAGT
jgi:hypothetical protein